MSAMAGALGTTLAKRDHYTLGDGERTPDAAMIAEARAVARTAWLLLAAALVWLAATQPHEEPMMPAPTHSRQSPQERDGRQSAIGNRQSKMV